MFSFCSKRSSTAKAADRMANDEDIQSEALQNGSARCPFASGASSASRCPFASHAENIPLNWKPHQGGHRPNTDTLRILQEAGGPEAVRQFTEGFYQKAFQDPVLDSFIRSHEDPHGERFANWIVEKFGQGDPWTQERRTRKTETFVSNGHRLQSPHDRSSAHLAAWHSPKREAHKWGQHFKLEECRVWMRLHFWAMREAGIYDKSPAFAHYYIKFLGHFVSVYERTAPMFAREAARWSEDAVRLEQYIAGGRTMPDVMGLSLHQAMQTLPPEERQGGWPYER